MKRILITGKNSYVGVSVKNFLEREPKKYRVNELDVKGNAWQSFDFKKYDIIFHVAGIAHVDTKKVDEKTKQLYYAVNTDLAESVAKKAKQEGIKQFIYMSSAIVYGNSAQIGKTKVITKKTQPAPANFYGDSKLQAEKKLQKLADKNFKVVLLRPPMIYGENCKGNYPTLRKFALKLPVFPKVKNSRSMIYIENFATFVKSIIDNEKSGIFLPSNPDAVSTSDLVKAIATANNKKLLLIPGLTWALKLLSHFTPFVNKAFGNLSYSSSVSNDNLPLLPTLQTINKMEGAKK